MREILAAGLAESAHDLSDGGLAVALSESCTARIGANVDASQPANALEFALFGEAPSRILRHHREPGPDPRNCLDDITSNVRRDRRYNERAVTDRKRDQTMWIDVATTDLKQSFEDQPSPSFSNTTINVG